MLGDMELGRLHVTAEDSRNCGRVESQTPSKVDMEIRAWSASKGQPKEASAGQQLRRPRLATTEHGTTKQIRTGVQFMPLGIFAAAKGRRLYSIVTEESEEKNGNV
jgi:hypothetical protein